MSAADLDSESGRAARALDLPPLRAESLPDGQRYVLTELSNVGDAGALWRQLNRERTVTATSWVFLDNDVAQLQDPHGPTTLELIAAADRIDPQQRFSAAPSEDPTGPVEFRTTGPGASGVHNLSIASKRHPVRLACFATADAWTVPAVLKWGLGESPDCDDRIALLRSWEHEFTARVAFLGFDMCELLLERPPGRTPAVVRAAQEMTAFAGRAGFWGPYDTTAELVDELAASSMWTMWFDDVH